jgi:hypothetical protein
MILAFYGRDAKKQFKKDLNWKLVLTLNLVSLKIK